MSWPRRWRFPEERDARLRLLVDAVAFIVIVGGFAFRVARLNRPVWHDEAISILQARGIGYVEAAGANLPTAGRYQALLVGRTSIGVVGAVARLFRDDPQHMPLHLVFTWSVASVFGVSKFAFRLVSCVLDVVATLALYGTAREAAESRTTSLWVAAIFSYSLLETQLGSMGRDYSTALAMSFLTIYTFLRSDRTSTTRDRRIHLVVAVMGALSHPLFVWTLAGLTIYSVVRRENRARRLSACLITLVVALAAAAPWYLRIARGVTGLAFVDRPRPAYELATAAVANFTSGVLDWWNQPDWLPLQFVLLLLIGLSTVQTVRRQCLWIPLAVLCVEPWVMLVGVDFAKGGQRSEICRYWMFGAAAGATFVAVWMTQARTGTKRRAAALAIGAAYLVLGTMRQIQAARLPTSSEMWGVQDFLDVTKRVNTSTSLAIVIGPPSQLREADQHLRLIAQRMVLSQFVPPSSSFHVMTEADTVAPYIAYDDVLTTRGTEQLFVSSGEYRVVRKTESFVVLKRKSRPSVLPPTDQGGGEPR